MYNRYREEEKALKEESKAENSETEVLETEEVNLETEDLQKLQEEVTRLNDLYLRTVADAENYKRRLNEERTRERKYGSQALLEKLIDVVDIFDKVVSVETEDEKLKNFLIGFEMINKQLKQIMADEGIKRIETSNQKFNPAYHHALEVDYQEEFDEDLILEEVQTGYLFKDRVLRPALVKVNKKKLEEK
ncbi:MAG: nucleotide exchange factor GrpE [Bacilli bacterium]|nr:nucleotide exchange factor GrpE [Bacilli bacterium]